MHLFTYGSLMFDPVWARVVRGRYRSLDATLAGYQRRRVKGDGYPALVLGQEHDRLTGRLYLDLGVQDMVRLDRFEGRQYHRRILTVDTGKGAVQAAVYLFQAQYLRQVSDQTWEPEWFARHGIHRFLNRYRGFR